MNMTGGDFGSGWNVQVDHIPWRWRHWRRLRPMIVHHYYNEVTEAMPAEECIWISLPTWNIQLWRPE